MTLQLEADDALMGGTTRLGPHFNLRLFLGKTPRDALSTLTAAVETWRQRFGFLVSNLCVLPDQSTRASEALSLLSRLSSVLQRQPRPRVSHTSLLRRSTSRLNTR